MSASAELGGSGGASGAPVSIQLLGRSALWCAGQEQPDRVFNGRLARQLLRMLAVSRGTVLSKDVAIEALWRGRRPADAAGNVEILASRVRRALGDRTLIRAGSGGYTLVEDDRCWVDVEAFLAAVGRGQSESGRDPARALSAFREALSLWQGEPLPEDAYAEWALEHRARLFRTHLEALEGAAGAALALGDTAAAAAWAQAAVDESPLREASALLLVRALADDGDRAAALAGLDAFGERLAHELGIGPSPEALRVRQEVLGGPIPPDIRAGRGARECIALRAGLSAQATEVAALLALTGSRTDACVVSAAAGLDLRATLDALAELGRAGLADAGEAGWSAVPGAAEAAGAGLDPVGRGSRHLLLARALCQHGADPAEVAAHLAAGGDRLAAVAAFAEAARIRLNRLEDAQARALAGTGLAIAPPGRSRAVLLQIRAEGRRRQGLLSQARADLDEALAEVDDGPERSRILARLAILEARSQDAARGAGLAEMAVAEAGEDPAALGQALAAGALVDLWLARPGRAGSLARRARRLLERVGDPEGTVRLLHWRAMAAFVAGRLVEAVPLLDRLATLPSTLSETLRLWNPGAARGHALVLLGEPEAGLREIDAALARASILGQPVVHGSFLWRRSEALAALGRHAEAVDSAEAALAIARQVHHTEWATASFRALGIAWQGAGDLERAEASFRAALRVGEANPLFAGWAAARLGLVLVAQGRLLDAGPIIDSSLRHGAPLVRHEADWAYAALLHASRDPSAPRVAAAALASARADGYQALVPRLAALT
ncbi:BTAD domain-containing putative transcriptional regulator [Sinomonas terrae]|uniref:Tetratricopeptide repeat protein n=1 Tax=Sinomonas terrae TaxID=2908838 RepID=A0ABS9U711_9MICC|nr:BTAD domain-containing putative transcriptional regulator [Sinomonas terrae]MCH6472491.1 tetratricopeptide repeat protein [Sinomonas terrae]